MFTIEAIKAAHAKVKTGADYPAYVREIIAMGISGYETLVSDGSTAYFGAGGFQIRSLPKYSFIPVTEKSNPAKFREDLKAHQQGKTDFPGFCQDCAASGVEKWMADLSGMTCTYFDKAGTALVVESIPSA
jgi:uncharacterized protein YbcV (DUF1398 family)